MTNKLSGNGKANWPLFSLLGILALGPALLIALGSDAITTAMLIAMGKEFGLPGVILVLWFLTNRTNQRMMLQYHDDVLEMRRMYENNVSLVKKYESLATDLKDIIVMNTQVLTKCCEDIEKNVFCPITRQNMGEKL